MTNASDTIIDPRAGSDTAPLRAKWGWIVALGVVYLIAGFIALGSVAMATVASVLPLPPPNWLPTAAPTTPPMTVPAMRCSSFGSAVCVTSSSQQC